MLRFAVDPATSAKAVQPTLSQAYTLGQDETPLQAQVAMADGELRCHVVAQRSAGVCLGFDSGSGTSMVATCLLQLREQPYRLVLELARNQIRLCLAKCDDWLFTDHPLAQPALKRLDQARELFTEAMVERDFMRAEHASREALRRAIEASEMLALAHAQALLRMRYASKGASTSAVGVRIDLSMDPLRLAPVLADLGVLIIPTPWRVLEPQPDSYEFANLDRWIQYAAKAGKRIVLGPLLDLSEAALPIWMIPKRHDETALRDRHTRFCTAIIHRYGAAVGMWITAVGLNECRFVPLRPETMVELTRRVAVAIRQPLPKAKLMVELAHPWGEDVAASPKAIPPLRWVQMLIDEGVRFDAVGVRLIQGAEERGGMVRDLLQISAMLERLIHLKVPIMLTAVGLPSSGKAGLAGTWRGPPSTELQARWLTAIITLGLSKRFIEMVCWGQLVDGDPSQPAMGLLTAAGKPKSAWDQFCSIRKRLKEPFGAGSAMPA
ncbi:MAG: hypothetical protein FJ254_05845 [Phycisphaerae bacterium]|nr:hypothetical protein [Phycisphaerae bacterium]